jgi:hypothetical protein
MRLRSLDLRERVAAAVDHHDGSIRGIARVFPVSTSFIIRLLQHRRAARTLAPEPRRGGRPPALGPDDLEHGFDPGLRPGTAGRAVGRLLSGLVRDCQRDRGLGAG